MPELSTLGAPIKTAYDAQPNTNPFTDAEQAKLAGIQPGAQVNPVNVSAFVNDADYATNTEVSDGLAGKISSNVTGIAGASAIANIVSISQEDYDALDPEIQNANTFLIPQV